MNNAIRVLVCVVSMGFQAVTLGQATSVLQHKSEIKPIIVQFESDVMVIENWLKKTEKHSVKVELGSENGNPVRRISIPSDRLTIKIVLFPKNLKVQNISVELFDYPVGFVVSKVYLYPDLSYSLKFLPVNRPAVQPPSNAETNQEKTNKEQKTTMRCIRSEKAAQGSR